MRSIVTAAAVLTAASVLAGCAKEIEAGTNEDAKRYFDAWIQINDPGQTWTKTANGLYIIENTEPSIPEDDREEITDSAYVLVMYTYTDLNGNIQATNVADSVRKAELGYDKSHYYGPAVWVNSDLAITVGVKDLLSGMHVGGKRKAVIPAWLNTSNRYGSEEEFLANVTDGSHRIYEVEIADATNDILRYQTDSIELYWDRRLGWEYENGSPHKGTEGYYNAAEHTPDNGGEFDINEDVNKKQFVTHWDTTYTGFRFRQYFRHQPEKDDNGSPAMKFKDDTTLYINYTGRLLNGQVFDTTIEDTAKFYNIYSTTRTYGPVEIKWSSDTTAITLGDSDDIIGGFKSMIGKLRNDEPVSEGEEERKDGGNDGESAVAIFYSNLGYGYNGSGSSIPGYAPLRFDITVVKQEEEE